MDERKYDEALGRLTSFIDRAPDSLKMEIQFNIGDCYYARGQYRDAIREFMKVKYLPVNTDEDFQWMVTALFQGGTAYEALGEMDKAVEIYEYIIQISGKETVYSKTAASRIREIRQH
jgi:tetratricopeptide (TPR) repeat protein